MAGQARAPGAGTVLNALATGTGAAFAIDAHTTATVSLDPTTESVRGTIDGVTDADTALIERCVSLVTARFGDGEGGTVRTESEVPLAAGLKSSSAAANATVVATLDALGMREAISREDAARIGVQAARETGVTVTGAFDDASASMLGGVTVTDNDQDELLAHETVDWAVAVYTPPERAYSADADVDRCARVAPIAELVAELALAGEYGRAMTVNGLAFTAALDFTTDPMLAVMPDVRGVSLSGTGPSYTAIGDTDTIEAVQSTWESLAGETWVTTTQSEGTIPI